MNSLAVDTLRWSSRLRLLLLKLVEENAGRVMRACLLALLLPVVPNNYLRLKAKSNSTACLHACRCRWTCNHTSLSPQLRCRCGCPSCPTPDP